MMRPSRSLTDRRRLWEFGLLCLVAVLPWLSAPGSIVADTKLDLAVDPQRFLTQASALYAPLMPLGQVQNQAYGYLFPHGAWFAAGQLAGIPAWITQRGWWSLLLVLGCAGMLLLARRLGLSTAAGLLAAVAFTFSPRILTTLGAISSEAHATLITPWVLLAILATLGPSHAPLLTPRRGGLLAGVAVGCAGAVNATATAAAAVPAALVLVWRFRHTPRRAVHTAVWWTLGLLGTCLWWVGALLILGRVSPPFVDFIESAAVTTRFLNLVEILRGTTSWTPFVTDERLAGHLLVTQPSLVLVTGLVAVIGLLGLIHWVHTGAPAARLMTVLFLVGVVLLGAGYAASHPFGSPIAGSVRAFLDGPGAALRNLHKFDALVHLPLSLGVGVGIATACGWATPRRRALAALGCVVVVLAVSPAWLGQLAPKGSFRELPEFWQNTAAYLAGGDDSDNGDAGDAAASSGRTLLLPPASSAMQTWGLTRDEVLQPLATGGWVTRDAVPMVPPTAIRDLDGILADLLDRPGEVATQRLLAAGIDTVVVRYDLVNAEVSPVLYARALRAAGWVAGAQFGAGAERTAVFHAPAQAAAAGAQLVDPRSVAIVHGAGEAIGTLQELDRALGRSQPGAYLDPEAATALGLDTAAQTVTDTPLLRQRDYGRVTAVSGVLATPEESTGTQPVIDYPAVTPPLAGSWQHGEITASSSVSDPAQWGTTDAAGSVTALSDADPATAWWSGNIVDLTAQTITVELAEEITGGTLTLTLPADTQSPLPEWWEVELLTADGTPLSTHRLAVNPQDYRGAELTLQLPATALQRILLRPGDFGEATVAAEHSGRVGLAEISLQSDGVDLTPAQWVTVPLPDGVTAAESRFVLADPPELRAATLRRALELPAPLTVTVTALVDQVAPTTCSDSDVKITTSEGHEVLLAVDAEGVAWGCAPLPLPAGSTQLVLHTPGLVRALELAGDAATPPQPDTPVTPLPSGDAWLNPTTFTAEVAPLASDQLLILPAACYPGIGIQADGVAVPTATAQSWQCAALLPAGTQQITGTMPLAQLYRWSLLSGPIGWVAVLIALVWPTRRRAPAVSEQHTAVPQPVDPLLTGAVATLSVSAFAVAAKYPWGGGVYAAQWPLVQLLLLCAVLLTGVSLSGRVRSWLRYPYLRAGLIGFVVVASAAVLILGVVV